MDQLSPERCRQLLEESPVAHLGVISDGSPYVTPISFVIVDGAICFRTGPGRRTDAIRTSPTVSIEVCRYDTETGHWESVVGQGRCTEVDDAAMAQTVTAALFEKYRDVMGSPLSPGGGLGIATVEVVMMIRLDEMTGRTSDAFFHASSRPGRL